jgi:hypothetical protein
MFIDRNAFSSTIWTKLVNIAGGRVNTTRLDELSHGVGYRVTEARVVETPRFDKTGVIVELCSNIEVFLPNR